MTYPAGYLAWLEALDSRFNITAGHIWEAAQKTERERIRARAQIAAEKTWKSGDWYIGPQHNMIEKFVRELLRGDGDDT